MNLPIDAKHYVYKLLTVKDIILNSKKYGVKIRPIANRPYFDQIKIHEPIDISLVTRLANISEVEFNALNPAYNRYVIKVSDAAPRTLLLPKTNKEIFLKIWKLIKIRECPGRSIASGKVKVSMKLQIVILLL